MNTAHRLALSCLALAAGAAAARADVETAFYWNDQLFSYEIKHMPDLDQRRAAAPGILGLPLDGAMHCAPTSALNMMIYCANHGFPEVWPGPGNYQAESLYNVATLNDLALGIAMGTDAGGSGPLANFEATKTWLYQSAPGRFTVSMYIIDGNYAPTMTTLAKTAIGGSIVGIGYGRYTVIGTYQGLDVVDRGGGHAVTLSRALRNGPDQLLGLRDPADSSDDWFSQSDFGTREVEITDRTIAGDFSDDEIRTVSSISYDAAKEKNAYIDRYIAIKPKQGYSWKPSPLTLGTAFKLIKVASFLGGPDSPGEETFALSGLVIDAVIAPDQTSVVAVLSPKSGGPTELHELDLLDGKLLKIATLPGAKSVHFSRHRTLYVAAPNQIWMVDLVEKKVEGSVTPPAPCEAIAYDDKQDELVALCSDAKKLLRWKEGLGGAPKIVDLPSDLVMGGTSTLAIDPTDLEVFFATEKSPALVSVTDDGTIVPCIKTWNLTGIPFPTALDVDDMGHLFATAGEKLHELALEGDEWKPVTASPFAGLTVDGKFRVTRSRNNFDPATMSGPAWDEIDPALFDGLVEGPFIPDCDGAPSNLEYGAAKPGTFGFPHLAALDLPTLGMPTSIQLSNGRPGAMPVLLLGTQSAALPFDGGLIHLVPAFVFPIPVPIGADGTLTIPGTLPGDASLCGFTLYHQMLFADPGAAGFYHTALTNGLARTFGS